MTAVEIYREELNSLVSLKESKFKTEQEIFEQAKEMEKEQIENAFNYGQFDLGMEADEYYKQIFKSE